MKCFPFVLALSFALSGLFVLIPAASPTRAADVAKENHIVMRDTVSPDGRYAFAWRFDGEGFDYDKIRRRDKNYCASAVETFYHGNPAGRTRKIENFLVDLESKKDVLKIEGSGYYNAGGVSLNHAAIRLTWRPDSKCAIYFLDSKWRTEVYRLYVFGEGGTIAAYDLKPIIEKPLRDLLSRKHPDRYRECSDEIAIRHDRESISPDGKLAIRLSGEVPKQSTFSFDARVNLVFEPDGKGALTVKSLDFERLVVDDPSPSD